MKNKDLINYKEREVYCYSCKMYFLDNRLEPRCKLCGDKLFTVLRNVLTGERLTGREDASTN